MTPYLNHIQSLIDLIMRHSRLRHELDARGDRRPPGWATKCQRRRLLVCIGCAPKTYADKNEKLFTVNSIDAT